MLPAKISQFSGISLIGLVITEYLPPCQENGYGHSSWGAPRIHGVLVREGFNLSERTASGLLPQRSVNLKLAQTRGSFLENM
jgi:hypothetical protein